jgi:cyclopropane fatty-acyl-phospholipid synthase-like methyltransferase
MTRYSLTHYPAVVTGPVFEFSEVFNEDYLYFYGPELEAVSDAQAETIWRLLDLEPGMEVLDLACGHGRIANRLTQRGARVTGLDATPLFLEHARRDAAERGVEADYVSGDMRSLPWPEHRFERIISWFTSFGYFDDIDNQKVLDFWRCPDEAVVPRIDAASGASTGPVVMAGCA